MKNTVNMFMHKQIASLLYFFFPKIWSKVHVYGSCYSPIRIWKEPFIVLINFKSINSLMPADIVLPLCCLYSYMKCTTHEWNKNGFFIFNFFVFDSYMLLYMYEHDAEVCSVKPLFLYHVLEQLITSLWLIWFQHVR